MLIGDPDEFAIELEPIQVVDAWPFGRFVLWLGGRMVGDPADESVHLKGCIGWLRNIVESPRDRFEPGLYGMEREAAYRALCDGVISHGDDDDDAEERYADTFARFHISHLGMSSFDRVTLLLVEDGDGRQRCIWRQGDEPVQDAFLPPGRMQAVASECVERFAADPDPG